MSATDWQQAAQKLMILTGQQEYEKHQARAKDLAAKLDSFIQSQEGRAALELLKYSNRHIVLAVSDSECGVVEVSILDGEGFKQGCEASGWYVAYDKQAQDHNKKTKGQPVKTLEIACDIDLFCHLPNNEVIAVLRRRLDELAKQSQNSAFQIGRDCGHTIAINLC